jgi:2-deoxy-D-gluconate 3-dehydrogenase
MKWVVITGGGSGIGRSLCHHFSREHLVLTCGRRYAALEETRKSAPFPERICIVQADIANSEHRSKFVASLPRDSQVSVLFQNAAMGDPDYFENVSVDHLLQSLAVNVVAPMALAQAFLPSLQAGKGRILHIGTSVAHSAQQGSLTYGNPNP